MSLGTSKIAILEETKLLQLEAKIDSLSHGYMSDENKEHYIAWLEDPSTKIKEHEGRHDAVKILGCSYYYRYNNGWKDLADDQRHDTAYMLSSSLSASLFSASLCVLIINSCLCLSRN